MNKLVLRHAMLGPDYLPPPVLPEYERGMTDAHWERAVFDPPEEGIGMVSVAFPGLDRLAYCLGFLQTCDKHKEEQVLDYIAHILEGG